MKILTFDIGGANTKRLVYRNGAIESSSTYFPVWKRKDDLPNLLSHEAEEADHVVVTMTAELCDVFTSKEEGARFIAESCEDAFDDPLFLTTNQGLVKKEDIKDYKDVAATNWQASRYYMEKRYGSGLLADIGSTTTDILPFGTGTKCGKSDLERLRASQLIYTGYLRTPLNTIVNAVPINGIKVPISSEHFAITADVYTILCGVDYTCETPDGKGKSRKESTARIARLLCADPEEVKGHIPGICRYIQKEQVKRVAEAVERVSKESKMERVYAAGVGAQLVIKVAELLDLDVFNLETEVKDAWNLPCHGLLEMALDRR